MEKWNNGDMFLKTWCVASFHNEQKTETEALAKFSSIHLLFAHRANGSLSFERLLMKKQTEVISLSWEGAIAAVSLLLTEYDIAAARWLVGAAQEVMQRLPQEAVTSMPLP
jgi:hypothetical protein